MFAEMPLDNLTVNKFRGHGRQGWALPGCARQFLAFSPAARNHLTATT
jgi:hypothetical protein